MELFLIKHVPISVENNCDDNQILISTSNHFYSHFFGGGASFNFYPVHSNSVVSNTNKQIICMAVESVSSTSKPHKIGFW